MGPKNIALVKLFQADQALRQAQERLDSASRGVRVQKRKVTDLQQKLDTLSQKLKKEQAQAAEMESNIQAYEARIEKLRTQQQTASNNKEYQAFLIEINTQKTDKKKIEDQTIGVMESVEKSSNEATQLKGQLETEQATLATLESQITDKVTELKAEVDRLTPARNEAAQQVPAGMRDQFDRMADRFDGEAMSPLIRTNPRREEYACESCNMALVVDVYNRLHTRDDLVPCPSCGRYLFIPEEMPVEQMVNKKKVKEKQQAE
jgi:predicted  nucleic acid-binding Zn-ribbon protein